MVGFRYRCAGCNHVIAGYAWERWKGHCASCYSQISGIIHHNDQFYEDMNKISGGTWRCV